MPYDNDAGPLVLGASGKVGTMLRRLCDTGEICFAAKPVFQYRRGDQGLVWDVLHQPAPDVAFSSIIVLAGQTGHDDLGVNRDLALAACELAAGAPVLLASTQAVYGPQDGIMSETDTCAPVTAYGRAKLAMEQAVASHDNVTCLRIGNVVGCDGLAAGMARGAVTLDQFTDGQFPQRAMIGPHSLCHALVALLAHKKSLPQTLNLAQAPLVGMDAILNAAGAQWVPRPAPDGALARLEMDLTALRNLVDLPDADPHKMIAQARLAGWTPPQ